MEFVRPNNKHLASYMTAILEEKRHRPDIEPYYTNPLTVVRRSRNEEVGINLKPGRVPSTTIWLVDGDRFIGTTNIRHRLNSFLQSYGGHIGYGVRYSECNKGYATQLLAKALEYSRDVLKLDRVLVTCDDDNLASARVIEKNRGILEDKRVNHLETGTVLTRRYWIDLPEDQ